MMDDALVSERQLKIAHQFTDGAQKSKLIMSPEGMAEIEFNYTILLLLCTFGSWFLNLGF